MAGERWLCCQTAGLGRRRGRGLVRLSNNSGTGIGLTRPIREQTGPDGNMSDLNVHLS
jgi:hypothetical protein